MTVVCVVAQARDTAPTKISHTRVTLVRRRWWPRARPVCMVHVVVWYLPSARAVFFTLNAPPAVEQVRRSLSRLVSGASSADKVPLAAFDADGTLWNGDAAEIFMDWMKAGNQWSHNGDFVER